MDIAAELRRQLKEAVERAAKDGHSNVAGAVNVGGSGHRVSVYSDDDVTVIERDGETQVIRHDTKGDAPT